MAKKRLSALENLLRSALKLDRNLSSNDRFWLWRGSLLSSQAEPSAGFILPTVTLLLLMLSLILGVLIFRTGNRTTEVIGDRQQRQVFNAATPAIERAKAKIEHLFVDAGLATPAPEDDIENTLRTDEIYRLDDETRLDLNGDGQIDNAWTFIYDSQGRTNDPTDDVRIVYSILSRSDRDVGGQIVSIQNEDDELKAESLVVRNAPINLRGGAGNPDCPPTARSPFQGWLQVTGSELRKALQVHAVAIPGPDNPNRTLATLEYQQDKVSSLGNKWAAWFRTDMEIFPGADFRWNGAMNSSGSYFIGGDNVDLYPISSPNSCVFTRESSEMIMSLIETNDQIIANNGEAFLGQFAIGTLRDNNFNGSMSLFPAVAPFDEETIRNNRDSVAAAGDGGPGSPIDISLEPVVLLTEGINRRRDDADDVQPTDLQAASDARDGGWDGREWVQQLRLYNSNQSEPFQDDTYRADDRFGPKPIYDNGEPELRLNPNQLAGAPADVENVIDPARNEIRDAGDPDRVDELIRLNPVAENERDYGLDGYWERRARAQGVRFIVGQRLELGNAFGWQTEIDADNSGRTDDDPGDRDFDGDGLLDFDPLYPPPANPGIEQTAGTRGSMADRQHELMQWKTLRSNPAAAQSAAVYHYLMNSGSYPVACLASAAHPGTEQTIADSTRFEPIESSNQVGVVPNVDFLNGQGTNGWEFEPYGFNANGDYSFNTLQTTAATDANLGAAHAAFASDVNRASSALRIALNNLANFSGDPSGAYPPVQDTAGAAGAVTHPYPIHTMWGDFSNLREVLSQLDAGRVYDDDFSDSRSNNALSLADQTTLQTASCTLGILAYNLDNALDGDGQGVDYTKEAAKRDELAAALDIDPEQSNSGGGSNSVLRNGVLQDGEIVFGTGDTTAADNLNVTEPDEIVVFRALDDRNNAPEIIYRAKWAENNDLSREGVVLFNPDPMDNANIARSIPNEIIVAALPNDNGLRDFAERMMRGEQIRRDRLMGFSQEGVEFDPGTNVGDVWGVNVDRRNQPKLQCDFQSTNFFGMGNIAGRAADVEKFLQLAFLVCPRSAKYPSLYYLFPTQAHDHVGTGTQFPQPDTEPYTSSSGLQANGGGFDNAYGIGVNGTELFQVVGDTNGDGIANDDDDETNNGGFASIALRPKSRLSWALPSSTFVGPATEDEPNAIVDAVSTPGTETSVRTSLLDKVIFDGREQMAVRVLDIDLDLLRRATIAGTNQTFAGGRNTTDWWVPLPELFRTLQEGATATGAAFYAFREDALREDGIARPTQVTPNINAWREEWRDFSDDTNVPGVGDPYVMNAAAFNTPDEQDPPVNPDNGISPKPVDYYPDPARRPHGFRLRKGEDLRRDGQDLTDERGLTFVTDNSAYIQGNFNEHRASTAINNLGARIEEFEGADLLEDDWDNFFDRTDINEEFAEGTTDSWRASDVIADAVNILSDEFVDGWISQGILAVEPSARLAPADSSFEALNHVREAAQEWVRQDGGVYPADENAVQAMPVKISQRGFPVYCDIDAALLNFSNFSPDRGIPCAALGGIEREYGLEDNGEQFITFSNFRALINVEPEAGADPDQSVNAVIFSGIIPSRVDQSNGGLHNFPRFLENWAQEPLRFQGSLFQLNFSNASTGQSDQDSWEPGSRPVRGSRLTGQQNINYYVQPLRRWGFDVGTQLVAPTPASDRFADDATTRSEFYQELDVSDPYIVNLRCVQIGGAPADPTCPE